MIRTINKNMLLRIVAQADEADIRGHYKIAERLTGQIEEIPVRGDEEEYEYSEEELLEDVRTLMWKIAIRVFDYHDSLPDGREISDAVDDASHEIISVFENLIPNAGVGKHEPLVPGEDRPQHMEVELEDFPSMELESMEEPEEEEEIVTE